jgi:hypothetical protein
LDQPTTSAIAKGQGGRFGDQFIPDDAESVTLVRGRERALDTISKKLERKSKWLEAHNSEGQTYYWNRETYETIWKKPKHGFLTTEEQKTANITAAPLINAQPSDSRNKHEPYGKWKKIEEKDHEDEMIDLQLPETKSQFVEVQPVVTEVFENTKIEFKEKTVSDIAKATSSKTSTVFKKRKAVDSSKRSVRRREDSDE